MNIKRIALTLSLLVTFIVFTSPVSAERVRTLITGKVVDISGIQIPVNIELDDVVTFRYLYDDAGTEAHNYHLDGTSTISFLSDNPNLTALSDAEVTYSNNLLATFSEFDW